MEIGRDSRREIHLGYSFRRNSLVRALLVAGAGSVAAGACDSGPAEADLTNLLADPTRHLISIGGSRSADAGVIGIFLGARLGPEGQFVVVNDGVPPFVKVFDSRGERTWAAISLGRGPEEAEALTAIGADATGVLTVDLSRRVRTLDHNGFLTTGTAQLPFTPIAVTRVCGEWWLYGQKVGDGQATWLHRLDLANGSVDSFLPESIRTGVGIGRPYGLVSSGSRGLLRHDYAKPVQLVEFGCDGPTSSTAAENAAGAPNPSAAIGEAHGASIQASGGSAKRAPAGLASLADDRILLADILFDPETNEIRTEFRLGGQVRQVRGAFVIADNIPGRMLLFGVQDPVPGAFAVTEDGFLRAAGFATTR